VRVIVTLALALAGHVGVDRADAQVPGTLTGVTVFPSPAPVNTPLTMVVQGSGLACDGFVDFGDDTRVPVVTRALPFTVTHTYRRAGVFVVQVDCGATRTGRLTATSRITVAPPASLPFSLRRLELRFDNGRGDVTVPRDSRDLTAYVDVLFNGTGQLIAQWEVDGRVLAVVHEYLTFGSRTTIRTPTVPPLPTFEPGLHRLTLRVLQPAVSFEIPVITYYVTAAPAAPPRLELVAPEQGATMSPSAATFQWTPVPGASAYRIDLFQEGQPAAIASAMTADTSYAVPLVTARRLTEAGRYLWRVTALSEAGGIVGESEARALTWSAAGGARR
jgi:hypothetical protein